MYQHFRLNLAQNGLKINKLHTNIYQQVWIKNSERGQHTFWRMLASFVTRTSLPLASLASPPTFSKDGLAAVTHKPSIVHVSVRFILLYKRDVTFHSSPVSAVLRATASSVLNSLRHFLITPDLWPCVFTNIGWQTEDNVTNQIATFLNLHQWKA